MIYSIPKPTRARIDIPGVKRTIRAGTYGEIHAKRRLDTGDVVYLVKFRGHAYAKEVYSHQLETHP